MNERPVYLDIESIPAGACPLFTGDSLPIEAGRCIFPSHPGCERTATDYILSEHYDFHFSFPSNLPQFSFYPVPSLGIFAIDHQGGSFVCDGSPFLLTLDPEPPRLDIYYLDATRRLHYLASQLQELLSLLVFCPDWKRTLGLSTPLPTPDEKMRAHLIKTFALTPISLPSAAPNREFHLFPSLTEAKAVFPIRELSAFQIPEDSRAHPRPADGR